jgi:hypothetical protein
LKLLIVILDPPDLRGTERFACVVALLDQQAGSA